MGLRRIFLVSLVTMLLARSAPATPDPLRGSVSWEQIKITTARGAIQILRPKSDVSPHQVVVYVHGYGGRVDDLWIRHRLPEQFEKSGLNAIFVAVEAPAWYTDKVRFPSLDRVLSLVQGRLGVKLPSDVIVVGHSAAYQTFLHWIGNRRLCHLILLDALYAGVSRLAAWVRYHPEHRLTVVLRSRLPVYNGRLLFVLTRKHRVVCRRFPSLAVGLTRRDQAIQTLFIVSQFSHDAIVSNEIVIPLLLRDRVKRADDRR